MTMSKVPGTFTVSPGDQGGYVTIAASHPGEIEMGDVDSWTFLAAQGDALAINIGEVEPTLNFNPWIRLLGPTGTLVDGLVRHGGRSDQRGRAGDRALYRSGLGPLRLSIRNGDLSAHRYWVPVLNPLGEIAINFGPGVGLWTRTTKDQKPSITFLAASPQSESHGDDHGEARRNAADDFIVDLPRLRRLDLVEQHDRGYSCME